MVVAPAEASPSSADITNERGAVYVSSESDKEIKKGSDVHKWLTNKKKATPPPPPPPPPPPQIEKNGAPTDTGDESDTETMKHLDTFDKMSLLYMTYIVVSLVGLSWSCCCVFSEKRRARYLNLLITKYKQAKRE